MLYDLFIKCNNSICGKMAELGIMDTDIFKD